jgi:hypothetical protein
MGKYDLQEDKIELMRKLYFDEFKSKRDTCKILGIGERRMMRIFKKMGWSIRTLKDAAKHTSREGLEKWRRKNGSWCKGLSQNDPKMKSLIEKGRQTQINNGRSKGENNPMYGKVSKTTGGFRKDLGHPTRSSWEANFARILIYLKIPYDYEEHTFKLKEGDTYTPDFYVPSKNKFYEIKGWETNDKHYRFIEQYPDKKLIIIKDKQYTRIIRKFSKSIDISDSETTYNKEEIQKLFLEYIKKSNKSNISVSNFQKEIKVSTKTIQRLYVSQKKFKELFYAVIEEHEKNIINKEFSKFYSANYPNYSRREFYKYFSRAGSIIQKYYNKKFGDFLKDFF